jgi:formate dehydrogenase gamma subunit
MVHRFPTTIRFRLTLPVGAALLLMAALAAGAAPADKPDQRCLTCHNTVVGKGGAAGHVVGPLKSPAAFIGSAHQALSCLDCHPGTQPQRHPVLPATRPCSDCHRPEGHENGYRTAPLITQLHSGQPPHSPDCDSCHGHHRIGRVDDPDSTVYWRNIPGLCGNCHANTGLAGVAPQVPGYTESVHGRIAARGGTQRPAVCSDCHQLHKVEQHAGRTPGQTTLIPPRALREQVCGSCHGRISQEYHASVHGQAVARGVTDAPVCTDCHGEHGVQPAQSAGSPVAPAHVVATCSRCHGNLTYVRLHKLPETQVTSYRESYHGQANEYGDVEVAHCASCHGTHDILAASSPRSAVNVRNLAQTCGKCHPGAGDTFPITRIHVAPHLSEKDLLLLLQALYILIILGSGAGFMAYIGLDLFAHWRLKQAGVLERYEHRLRHLPVAPPDALVRMLPVERLQHWLLLISFFVLAFTGLALLVPDTVVGKLIVRLCGGPSGRATVHHLAGVVMIANFVAQGIWMGVSKQGRDVVTRLLPRPSDLRDLWQSIVLYLGFSQHRPSFRRFGYPEKFEFWALVWGTFVMTITGLLLWFVNWTLGHAPKWVLDVSLIIHKWEAILAVEAILIWHLYHVIWKPGVYPGNRAWLNGKISQEQLVMEHPLDYAEAMGWLPGPGAKREEEGASPTATEEGDTS